MSKIYVDKATGQEIPFETDQAGTGGWVTRDEAQQIAQKSIQGPQQFQASQVLGQQVGQAQQQFGDIAGRLQTQFGFNPFTGQVNAPQLRTQFQGPQFGAANINTAFQGPQFGAAQLDTAQRQYQQNPLFQQLDPLAQAQIAQGQQALMAQSQAQQRQIGQQFGGNRGLAGILQAQSRAQSSLAENPLMMQALQGQQGRDIAGAQLGQSAFGLNQQAIQASNQARLQQQQALESLFGLGQQSQLYGNQAQLQQQQARESIFGLNRQSQLDANQALQNQFSGQLQAGQFGLNVNQSNAANQLAAQQAGNQAMLQQAGLYGAIPSLQSGYLAQLMGLTGQQAGLQALQQPQG